MSNEQSFVTIFDRSMQSFGSRLPNFRRPHREGKIVTVGRVDDLPEGRGATVELHGGKEVALYRVDGEFFAVENFCPHKGAPLADGTLCGRSLICDWHGWRFDLKTGACLNQPADSVETYEVVIEDGWIKLIV